MITSYLFVPGDKPDLMLKAEASQADALILDLEDAVAPISKSNARNCVAKFLQQRSGKKQVFVRLNALNQGMIKEDLDAVLDGRVDGFVLPKTEGGHCLAQFAELTAGVPVKLIAIVTETPRAIFGTGTYGGITPRLAGMTWGAEDLSSAIGATVTRNENGCYRPPYELARSMTLFGAHAAGVDAIEAVYPDFRDLEGLKIHARRAREDGFTAMMAIHPAQIAIINDAFAYSKEEILEAQQIVQLFKANPDAGSLGFNGRMVDVPHLARARRILQRVER
jgi:citrate lyase subunit beta / citryl-CoA lyase